MSVPAQPDADLEAVVHVVLVVESIAADNDCHDVAVAASAVVVLARTAENAGSKMPGVDARQSAGVAFAAETPNDLAPAPTSANCHGADEAGSAWTVASVATVTCS
jgi:hypothetical protein